MISSPTKIEGASRPRQQADQLGIVDVFLDPSPFGPTYATLFNVVVQIQTLGTHRMVSRWLMNNDVPDQSAAVYEHGHTVVIEVVGETPLPLDETLAETDPRIDPVSARAVVTNPTLLPAAPNSMTRSTTLRWQLPFGCRTEMCVFDVRGRAVWTLQSDVLGAAEHSAVWDGLDDPGRRVPSGRYYARLAGGGCSV